MALTNEPIIKKRKQVESVLLLRLRLAMLEGSFHPINFRPPYSLKYVESLLLQSRAASVRLIDQRITNLNFFDILGVFREIRYDLVVIDVSTLNSKESLKFCELIRGGKQNCKTVLIGIGQEISANAQTYSTLGIFDILIAGEAEVEIFSIIERLNEGISIDEIKEYYKHHDRFGKELTVADLDELPYPVYSREDFKGYSYVYPLKLSKRIVWGNVLSSRGCPNACIFCSQITRESYGKKLRLRSAVSVVDEIEYQHALGANMIAFTDDNFTTSVLHVESICREIKSRNLNIKWAAHARVDEVDRSLIRLMKDAGCILLRFGIESGSKRVVEFLGKTRNPDSWFLQSKEAVAQAKSLGISVACLFIIGSPTETSEDIRESVAFAKELSPDVIQVAYFTPFPGSQFYTRIKGGVDEQTISWMYHYNKPLINFSAMEDSELNNAQALFYKSFLLRPSFIFSHFRDHFLFYVFNPGIFRKLFGSIKKLG